MFCLLHYYSSVRTLKSEQAINSQALRILGTVSQNCINFTLVKSGYIVIYGSD